jgi:hypothetical protein
VIAPVLAATATAAVVITYNLHQEFVKREREREIGKNNIQELYKTRAKHSNTYTTQTCIKK